MESQNEQVFIDPSRSSWLALEPQAVPVLENKNIARDARRGSVGS
jgi:hypothetical protein